MSKRPRGLSDADFLAELLDMRTDGMEAITALHTVRVMDAAATAVIEHRRATLVARPGDRLIRTYRVVKTA